MRTKATLTLEITDDELIGLVKITGEGLNDHPSGVSFEYNGCTWWFPRKVANEIGIAIMRASEYE